VGFTNAVSNIYYHVYCHVCSNLRSSCKRDYLVRILKGMQGNQGQSIVICGFGLLTNWCTILRNKQIISVNNFRYRDKMELKKKNENAIKKTFMLIKAITVLMGNHFYKLWRSRKGRHKHLLYKINYYRWIDKENIDTKIQICVHLFKTERTNG